MLAGKYLIFQSILLVSLLLLCTDCRTANAQAQNITTEELQEMMLSGQDFVLINVLPKIIYDSMHLPGSVNYPIGKLEKLEILPFPNGIPLIFYCMGYL